MIEIAQNLQMGFESILKQKSLSFATKIVQLKQKLVANFNENVLSTQLLRSGTAIGALIREAEHASSKRDFLNKLTIALKEANESLYWIELLKNGDYLTQTLYESLLADCSELVKMLVASIKTIRSKLVIDDKR